MSIHPTWATAILSGTKTVELRRRRLAIDIDRVYMYATAPVSRVVGWFTVRGVMVETPRNVWRRWGREAAIDRATYDHYFRDASAAVAIIIGEVAAFPEPVSLSSCLGIRRPPQSYQYMPSPAALIDVGPKGLLGRSHDAGE